MCLLACLLCSYPPCKCALPPLPLLPCLLDPLSRHPNEQSQLPAVSPNAMPCGSRTQDVQPAHEAEWATNPFELNAVNEYLYGRGTSDNKVP